MNLPNKLTLLRTILVPFFLLFLFLTAIPFGKTIALFLFVAAAITDAMDGHIARKNNLVTNFGKFLDPLADKVLVIAALVAFIELDIVGAIPVIIIIAREFMVSGLRLIAAGSGIVGAAGFSGKLKTAFTMIAVIFILVHLAVSEDFEWFGLLSEGLEKTVEKYVDWAELALIWLSTALTVISGCVYLKGYWNLIDADK